MTLGELKERPSIKAHWAEVSGSIDEYLVQHLIETCLGGNPDATTAEAQVGASKAIANIIKTFRSVRTEPGKRKPISMKKLHRFNADKSEGEEPKTSAQ